MVAADRERRAPMAWIRSKKAWISATLRTTSSGSVGASPTSATLQSSNGLTPVVGLTWRISREASRTPAGPWRAPIR